MSDDAQAETVVYVGRGAERAQEGLPAPVGAESADEENPDLGPVGRLRSHSVATVEGGPVEAVLDDVEFVAVLRVVVGGEVVAARLGRMTRLERAKLCSSAVW